MTRLRGLWTAAGAVTLLLLSGCAQAGAGAEAPPSATGSSGVPGDGDTLMLRVAHSGGFVGPDALAGRMPETSVYADGRVIFNGPVPAVYPGPALPNVQVLTISPDALGALIDKAVAAGVEDGADFGHPGVADAPTTEITVWTASGEQKVGAEALNEARADDPELTAAQKQAREKLLAFTEQLNKMTTEPTGGTPQEYRPETLAAIVRPYVEPGDGLPERPQTAEWPGPALPGESLSPTTGLSCVTATGKQADAVLAAAKDANSATPWISGGDAYSVRLRPLLPDETGCADLKAAR
ncbi:hypothetical protein [Actinoplanes sp. NPDC026623]|uniref:hypothetical protein n=1 Tax=Actinoplanes sp. NPDC026623 TaxID=3155610 RepID=UPI0033D0066D